MEDKDEDNIYIYTEEPEDVATLDDSGPNFSQSETISSDTAENEGDPEELPHDNPFSLLLRIMLNPIEGWKAVRRQKISAETVAKGCFYPLVAIVSLAQFFSLIYFSNEGLSTVIENVIITFVSFFFGYFCVFLLLKVVFYILGSSSIDNNFGKVFILYNISTLCIFFTIVEILPMLWAVLIFLPLWTVYLICRGARFFHFPEKRQIISTALLSLGIVGIPFLLGWLLENILPHIK